MEYCTTYRYAQSMLSSFRYYDNAHYDRLISKGIEPNPFVDGLPNDDSVGFPDFRALHDSVSSYFLYEPGAFHAIASLGGNEYINRSDLSAFIAEHQHDCF
jgi:hypothetical protein